MPEPRHSDPERQKIIDATISAGHGHVFRWWNDLDEAGRNRLLDQLSTIDFDQLNELYEQYTEHAAPLPAEDIAPADVIPVPRTEPQKARAEQARSVGEQAMRAGEVAVFVVAGGQATRLGMDAPKGTLRITPVKGKSIFRHHAEKLRALSRRYETTVPFYVMTSETNHGATKEFFEQNAFFGLDPADVFFFIQEMVPALDREGKLILDAKDHIFTNPNGHGGSISSLYTSGALADMQARGIRWIFYFQVDNVLIKMADPLFLGYHVENEADMSAKVVPKRNPEEKVGVVCRVGEATTVIEYIDLPDTYRYAKNEDDSLKFSAGNVAIHMFTTAFVERLNSEQYALPFHIAQKAIPCLDAEGTLVQPDEKNGLKFEKFVFDALSRARATAVMEVVREKEFAPIKNAEGEDSPATARELMVNLWAQWLEEAGVRVPRDAAGNVDGAIEISPLFALDANELKRKLPEGFAADPPLYLGPE